MSLILWQPELEFGLPVIDKQHRKLVDLINELDGVIRNGTARTVISTLMGQFMDYAGYHFLEEERLMEKFDYPDFELHKTEHDDYITRIAALLRYNRTGHADVSVELLDFLQYWWTHHIQKVDRNYVAFFQGKAVS